MNAVETATTTCPRHPKVETVLRCASCNELICPRCLVHTPVGAKCPTCASSKGVAVFTPSPLHIALAGGTGLVLGAVAGWGAEFSVGYFTFILAFIYGGFAGGTILRASGRKRGLKMEVIAGVSLALGAVGGRVLTAASLLASPGAVRPPLGVLAVLIDPFPMIAIAIVVAAAVSRIRYL